MTVSCRIQQNQPIMMPVKRKQTGIAKGKKIEK